MSQQVKSHPATRPLGIHNTLVVGLSMAVHKLPCLAMELNYHVNPIAWWWVVFSCRASALDRGSCCQLTDKGLFKSGWIAWEVKYFAMSSSENSSVLLYMLKWSTASSWWSWWFCINLGFCLPNMWLFVILEWMRNGSFPACLGV